MSSPNPKEQPQASPGQAPQQASTEDEGNSGDEYDDGYGTDL